MALENKNIIGEVKSNYNVDILKESHHSLDILKFLKVPFYLENIDPNFKN
ncbi:hypothetical protein [Helicobacter didelphidarum]|nr:hypothetical protein [Helicobacter didelphidarum]